MKLTHEEVHRYSRHLTLPEIGMSGQLQFKSAKVLLVGAGGLGSPVGMYLAAAGIGTLGIVDFDVVDSTNLQRQIAHTADDVGRLKVESIQAALLARNPAVKVQTHNVRLTRQNVLEILEPYDLVIDGSDNFQTRYLVNDAAYFTKKPLVYGSIFKFQGQATVFAPHQTGPCYRCLYPSPPPPSLAPS